MNTEHKAILIQSILSYLKAEVIKKNKKLASENLHHKQEAFNESDMYFKLAFMSDTDLQEISSKILG